MINIFIMVFHSDGSFHRGVKLSIPNIWHTVEFPVFRDYLRYRFVYDYGHPPAGAYIVTSEGDGVLYEHPSMKSYSIPPSLYRVSPNGTLQ
jgi:hypothetical protein